jgi:hypothetical protein
LNATEILTQAKAANLRLWLESHNGKQGIAYDDVYKVRPFIKHIKANRAELIKLLKRQLPKPPPKVCPGAIRLELATQWLQMNNPNNENLIQVPTFLRWLVGWLTPSKQREWANNTHGGDDGRLPWRDWKAVCRIVEAQFQSDLEGTSS